MRHVFSSWPNTIGKLYVPLPPSLPPSFLLDLFLSAVWGHYGVFDLNSFVQSLLLFWCICPPCLRDKLPRYALSKTAYLCKIKFKGRSCSHSVSGLSYYDKYFTQVLPTQTKTQRGGSARVPSCHEEVWEWSWSAVTPHLTDVLSGSMLRVGWGSRRCQSQIQWRMKTECVLTRTLPVSVWAEIMTPAQSLTEVIQPTSLAAGSSLSVRLMPSPVVIRWTSWNKAGSREKPGYWKVVNTKWLITYHTTVFAVYS